MTTIAWDGRTVAADSQVAAGGVVVGSAQKLRHVGDTVYSLTGSGCLFDPMIKWAEAGLTPEAKPVAEGDAAETTLLIFRGGRAWMVKPVLPYLEELFAPDAWGAGAEIAIGALDHGASAEQAVQIAIKRSIHTGGAVQTIDLQNIEAKAA
jgi:hypothetical protein